MKRSLHEHTQLRIFINDDNTISIDCMQGCYCVAKDELPYVSSLHAPSTSSPSDDDTLSESPISTADDDTRSKDYTKRESMLSVPVVASSLWERAAREDKYAVGKALYDNERIRDCVHRQATFIDDM
ncbi:hypothetical protein H257_08058 [Aphanomyces astaci]|uniref:Uncharacterized protein n=1 Tax=Aphanomyces astaci TaxID=112090 RepID=W4GH24_APHAT|nr:hypothetical protein H257_08058 [Aphanomyces astaci]ETV78551.1 hypothetical protein H257_08058 [Aphanomyces astaci]|eukprot:XP_009832132.1 hypothetical protein H257_08058 [Aphanomyces astaci]